MRANQPDCYAFYQSAARCCERSLVAVSDQYSRKSFNESLLAIRSKRRVRDRLRFLCQALLQGPEAAGVSRRLRIE